jgi:hypothetical protein
VPDKANCQCPIDIFTAPPLEDLSLDQQGALAGHRDGAEHLPAAGAVLLQATAGRVNDSDLGRPEVGVRDQVDNGIPGGLEAGVMAPPAAATTRRIIQGPSVLA